MVNIEETEPEGDSGADMIAWLQSRSPEDWHFVGDHLNWDNAMGVIQWILDQKTCDKATAAMMFWKSDPIYYLQFANREAITGHAAVNLDGFDFTKKLLERWTRGFYNRSSIAFAPLPHLVELYRRTEAQYAANGLPWRIDDELTAVRQGADILSDREYRRRYSDELARLLEALGTYIPHPDSKGRA